MSKTMHPDGRHREIGIPRQSLGTRDIFYDNRAIAFLGEEETGFLCNISPTQAIVTDKPGFWQRF